MNAVNSPETSLEGKVAIVTGAGSGLGKFEAIGLAKAGASLVVNDLAPNEAVEATLEENPWSRCQGRIRGRQRR